MQIEEIAEQVLEHLIRQPGQSQEAMHLKLALEMSSSNLFLALGWLLREGRITLEKSEYGFMIRCQEAGNRAVKIAEEV